MQAQARIGTVCDVAHSSQFTTGAKGGSGLDPARQWVRLSWRHIEDLHGLNMQASYYRIDRKGPDDADFVEIGGGAGLHFKGSGLMVMTIWMPLLRRGGVHFLSRLTGLQDCSRRKVPFT